MLLEAATRGTLSPEMQCQGDSQAALPFNWKNCKRGAKTCFTNHHARYIKSYMSTKNWSKA
eukprot:3180728-Amphidinium_carterae.1